MYGKYIKRLLDIIGSILGIIICLPILVVIGMLVRIRIGKPVIFKQSRISKDNKRFIIYKFRTMLDAKERDGSLMPDALRVTKLGSILRSTSFDELPELVNILKGDISFVGPRPLITEYLPLYTEYELQRHKVRGGLIPPEVLYGNIMPTWEQQFEYEVYYANHVSYLLDVQIIASTIKSLFKRNAMHYGNYSRDSFYEERIKKERIEKSGEGDC